MNLTPETILIAVVFASQIGVLLAGLLRARSPFWFSCWMYACLVAQVLPMYLSMPWMLKVARAFRAMPPPTLRSVELRQWRIADFVSPVWIVLGLGLQIVALACAVYACLHPVAIAFYVAFCCVPFGALSLALLARMIYVMSGPAPLVRADPYMSAEDTFRIRQRRFTLLFRYSAWFGALSVLIVLYPSLHFDYGYIIAALSALFQLYGLQLVSDQARDLRTRDFSVYRAASSTDGSQAG